MEEKIFENKNGFGFKLNSKFRDITDEERIKYNFPDSILNNLINMEDKVEIKISLDGYYDNYDLKQFYEVCKNNMINYGYQVVSEEIFESTMGLNKEAYKLLARKPNGTLQVSYFMSLTDKKDKGYALGCLMGDTTIDHSLVESYMIEMINTWYYI